MSDSILPRTRRLRVAIRFFSPFSEFRSTVWSREYGAPKTLVSAREPTNYGALKQPSGMAHWILYCIKGGLKLPTAYGALEAAPQHC